jgi:hypothetical protein
MNLRVPKNAGKFSSSCTIGSFSRRAQLHEWVSEVLYYQGHVLWTICIYHNKFWITSVVIYVYGRKGEVTSCCRIWGYHSGGYEELYLLGYSAV